MFNIIAALPLWAKVALGVIALLVSILLSPFMIFVALFVLVVAIAALIFRALRRRPLKRWGLVALTSLILIIVFSGITYALYAPSQQEQASTPSESEEEESEQETPTKEAEQEASDEEAGPAEEEAAEGEVPDDTPATPAASDADEEGSDSGRYDATVRVRRIVDGDTIRISPAIDGIDEVRLIGVDTPETKEPGCEVQPYGPEASEFATRELQGEEVDLEFDEEKTDRYDRLLAYVYKDDEMFNEDLLEGGYAQVYIVDPNDEYEDRFEEVQAEAQAAPRGIWALSIAEQAQLTDRNNGIGTGDGCQQMAAPPPTPRPAPSPAPNPAPSPAPSPARTSDIPSAPSAPAGRSGLTCADFSTEAEASAAIPANPQLDRDKDGRACETLP